MANLNEDVLRHIFDYLETPLDWIQVSKVCQLWKTAAQDQWKKIRGIRYFDADETFFSPPHDADTKSVIISAKDAEMMINCSAPFVKIIEQIPHFKIKHISNPIPGNGMGFRFGPFSYRVKEFRSDLVMEIIVEEATNLLLISLDRPLKLEMWEALVENNDNLHSVHFLECDGFYKNARTDKVKHLDVSFDVSKGIESFEGHFPDLTSLQLALTSQTPIEIPGILSPLLPFTLGLKNLRLTIGASITFSEESLFEIAKLSKLEYLVLDCKSNDTIYLDPLISRLVTGCPKLQSIDFKGMCAYERGPGNLLTLPCLKKLSIPYVDTLEFQNLPENINLVELSIQEVYDEFSTEDFCSAIRRMPKLRVLQVNGYAFETEAEPEALVREVVRVALSQNRDFVLDTINLIDGVKLSVIVKKSTEPAEFEGLKFLIDYLDIDQDFIEDLRTFVKENFGNHFAVTCRMNP